MIICVKYIFSSVSPCVPFSALVTRPDGKFLSRQVFVVYYVHEHITVDEYKDYVNVQALTVVS